MNLLNEITTIFTKNRIKESSANAFGKEESEEEGVVLCEKDKASVDEKSAKEETISPFLKNADSRENELNDSVVRRDTNVKNENSVEICSAVEDDQHIIPEKLVEMEETSERKEQKMESKDAEHNGENSSDKALCQEVDSVSDLVKKII